MASVRIEDEAFSDVRIDLLGSIAGYNRFEALGRMASLWRICTNRGVYVVSEVNVIACLGAKGVEAIIQSDLGERQHDGIRIKGTHGRIEWLKSKREAGRRGGEAKRSSARAEAKQNEAEAKQNEAEAKQNEAEAKECSSETKPLTLTLTPTLTLALKESESAPQKSESIDRHEAAFVSLKFPERFRELVKRHPHKAPASRAETEWKIVATSEESVAAIESAHAAWMACEQWQDGVGIPTLANFLRERWFDNVPEPAPAKPKRSSGGKESVAEMVARLERKRLEQEGAKS